VGGEGRGRFLAKSSMVVAGWDLVRAVFTEVDARVVVIPSLPDGEDTARGAELGRVEGPAESILAGERLALNCFQRLCGVAGMARRAAAMLEGLSCRVLDTRKTTPGLRAWEKYAVAVGGGANHRFGLFDGILIKDNHIDAAGGMEPAVRRAMDRAPHLMQVEVEVRDLDEYERALSLGVKRILLDNFGLEELRRAVELRPEGVLLEASGCVTLETLRAVAETGVDFVSMGALTHSAPAADISLEMEGRHARA